MTAPLTANVLVGDCREQLRTLPADSVQTCVTSPPYWGLRDYGCDGQLGLERTPEEYVAKMVEVFREVRRLLKPDGTLWLNLGDSYACGSKNGEPDRLRDDKRGYRGERLANGRRDQSAVLRKKTRAQRDGSHAGKHTAMGAMTQPNRMPIKGLKSKDLVGIPWRVAFALQQDGWYLRCDIIWSKPSAMPEAVKDRPTRAHEYVFLLSKSERYFYDYEAVLEPVSGTARPRGNGVNPKSKFEAAGSKQNSRWSSAVRDLVQKRNRRSVWSIATEPYPGAHFAVFPEALPQVCILAGTKPGDLVLDPFAGSGTTGAVALKEGRCFVGCELNPKYVELARRRMLVTPMLPLGVVA